MSPLRPLCLAASFAGCVVGVAGACTSDAPKRADGGEMRDAGPGSDAGPIMARADDKEASDAGAPDAGPLVVDAGAGPTPGVTDHGKPQVDAGTMHDVVASSEGGGKAAPLIEGGTGTDAAKDSIHHTVWNRLIVKTRAKGMAPADVQELVEQATGQKVEKVRKTAGTFWLVQLAPVTPVRKKDDQQKLVDKLKASGAFATVEGDQVMTLKTP
jgi:hypothetical protein